MQILQAITDDYISTAEPVGSRTIARRYNLGISPATIRNEMADLEESGYLEQPHTSAGRIPSEKGYRFYVDMLMAPRPLSDEERRRLRQELGRRQRAIEDLVHDTSRMLALLTKYTAVVVAPQLSESVFQRIELVPLGEEYVLVVLVTEPGFVHHRIAALKEPVVPEELAQLSQFMNEYLRGIRVSELGTTLLSRLREEIRDARLYQEAMTVLTTGLDSSDEHRVYVEGALHIFDQPEFQSIERARPVLSLFGEPDAIRPLLSELGRTSGTRVTIGHEIPIDELASCSLVTATYEVNGELVGTIGVIGPTRMDYARAVSLVSAVAQGLSETLSRMMRTRGAS